MKKQFQRITLFLTLGALVFSCAKDDFTEEDALTALSQVSLQVGVLDASNSDSAVADATVKTTIGTEAVEVTTNANGVAIFENVEIGSTLNIYVSKDNYTTVYQYLEIETDDYRQTVISTNIDIYSLDEANTATISGNVTAEFDLTNREKETVADIEVIVYNSSLSGNTRFFPTTTDSEGNYSVQIPANSEGFDDVYVYFPAITHERTAGEENNSVYSVETKTASYIAGSYSETAVDRVPSAVLSIDAPESTGSGFELGLQPVSNLLSNSVDNEGYEAAVISGGSGYDEVSYFTFEADANGNKAQLVAYADPDFGGTIAYVNIENNGAYYTEMPDIVTNPTNGSGAEFDLRYRYRYNVYIKNKGTNYINFPTIGLEYYIPLGEGSKLSSQYIADLSSSYYSSFRSTYITNDITIKNGKICSYFAGNGDTLFTTGYLYGKPSFTITEPIAEIARFYTYYSINSSDSCIQDNFSFLSAGDGYDYANPPAIEVVALAGWGSGAEVKAEVNASGEISDLVVMKKGSGYVYDINDYDNDGYNSEEEDATFKGFSGYNTSSNYGYFRDVKAGSTYVGNLYYGTGMVIEDK